VHLQKINRLVIGMLPATDIGAMDTPTWTNQIEISCSRWSDRLNREGKKDE
jgi:hypothetical protein